MRRLLAAALLWCGCGRISFDPRSDQIDAPDAAPLVCPTGYTFDTGSCYRKSTAVADWFAAEAACEADARGAHLVVISTPDEAAVAERYLQGPTDFAWIGVSDVVVEGTYLTVANRASQFLVWAMSEPEGPVHDCLLLTAGSTLFDYECTSADDYICEYDGIPAVSLAWGVCPAGYTFIGQGCYRAVTSDILANDAWFVAEAACEADGVGSHLVVLDTLAEAMVIDAFVPTEILDHWVGATDLVTEGVFTSVTNGPFGYMTYASGEPDGGTIQNCLVMTDAVELVTGICDSGDDYVCEYDGIPAVPAAWGQ